MSLDVTSEHALDDEEAATRRAAMAAFFESYWERLVAFARRHAYTYKIPESRLDAEGIAQQAILGTLERWDTIENHVAYAYTIASRLAWRAGQDDMQFNDLAVLDDRDDQPDDFDLNTFRQRWRDEPVVLDDPAEAVIQHEAVRAALKELPHKQRVATYLRVIEGKPSKEIGEIIGSKPATVDVHVHSGLKTLRERYGRSILAGLTTIFLLVLGWSGLKRIDHYLANRELNPTTSPPDPTATPSDLPTDRPSGWIDLYPIGDTGSSSGGGLSWAMIIIGGLLVLLGIAAIALILMRRNRDDDEAGRPN